MEILFRIGMPVMVSMMCCPPEHPLLGAGLRQECQQKLRHTVDTKGTVAEVAMKARRNGEHSNRVRREQIPKARPLQGNPQQQETSGMQWSKRNDGVKVKRPLEKLKQL